MSLLAAGDLNPLDAFKIIRLIYVVAQKAKVHRETCTEFAIYLAAINNLLQPIQQSPQLGEHPAVKDALGMLHNSLVKAFLLIQKCERTSTLSALLKHVPRQLKELEGEIQKILSLLNLANLHVNLHITTNGSTSSLNKTTTTSSYADVAPPSLEVTSSLQEDPAHYSHISTRSMSVPSTSAQGLATAHCVSAKSLAITWGTDERYWKWVERKGSRSNEVAYLAEVFWLEVQGQLSLGTLRPGKYTLSWRLQVASLDKNEGPSGWEDEPVIFKLSTSDSIFPQRTERSCFLVDSGKAGIADKHSKLPLDQNGSAKGAEEEEEFSDGWQEYEVGTFKVKKKQKPLELTFSLTEVNGSWKRGLFIDSVVINPCEGSVYEDLIAGEASSSTPGLEDPETLPEMISFLGHQHELKLMKDPYWFACAVCEATELGLGYHCHKCQYSVHPECSISDHHFATLLDLTDSEPSHWHWEMLLQLNKHRVEEKSSRPKAVMFADHPHALKLTQSPHPSFICDARYCDGHGWVYKGWDGWIYRCEGCDFDVHPHCRV